MFFHEDDLTRYWLSPYLLAVEGDEGQESGGSSDATVVETPEPAEGGDGDGQPPVEAVAVEPVEDPDKPKAKAWWMDRIDKLTGQKGEAERRTQVLEQQVRALRSTLETYFKQPASGGTQADGSAAAGATSDHVAGTADDGPRTYTRDEMIAEAQRLAQDEAKNLQTQQAEADFNQRCNQVAAVAQAKHADFGTNLAQLQAAGVMDRQFLDGVTALDDAPDILNHLGKHPEEALRIRSLAPIPMAVALAKLSATLGAAPAARAPSGMPAPVTGVRGSAVTPPGSIDDPNLPYDKWLEIRESGLKARAQSFTTRH